MQRKSMGVIDVDFNATGQILIIYSALVKYLRKYEKTMKQCISYLWTSRKPIIQVLYNILIEFCILMTLVRLIKMFLNETCRRVWVGKHLSDMFPVKNDLTQGVALSPLLINCALVCAIWRV
jgi:hypothetical protein